MPVAAGTVDLHASHEEFRVRACLNHFRIDRLPETGPTRTAVEFVLGRKERQVAPGAVIDPDLVILMERVCKGPFRIFVPQHSVGQRRQEFLPFSIGF